MRSTRPHDGIATQCESGLPTGELKPRWLQSMLWLEEAPHRHHLLHDRCQTKKLALGSLLDRAVHGMCVARVYTAENCASCEMGQEARDSEFQSNQ